ncbi:MAG: hypothetical protein LW807_05920 [Proteobacteria bacterium]|nr:hypothetical protein [Pseudomonadota bacterium]
MRLLTFILMLMYSYGFADCLFKISNYSDYSVTIEVGFYKAESKSLVIPNSSNRTIMINSDYNCLSSNLSGNGLSYINLIGGKSIGGWRYIPQSNMLRAMGNSAKSENYVMGCNFDGNILMLMNNYKPESHVLSVMIKPSQFRVSKMGSSN